MVEKSKINILNSSILKYFIEQGDLELSDLLTSANVYLEETDYDNWNGGIYTYQLIYEINIKYFIRVQQNLSEIYSKIKPVAELFWNFSYNQVLGSVRIIPLAIQYINWKDLPSGVNKKVILSSIEEIKASMISVATGARIEGEQARYTSLFQRIDTWLNIIKLENPNPYKGLWEWYTRWKQEDLSNYSSRRNFVSHLYQTLIETIQKSEEDTKLYEHELTGWDRVDRSIYEMKKVLAKAMNEENFQTIGMLGRETLITIAQQVYNDEIHKPIDETIPSSTDSKRMLEAFVNHELQGGSNERTRKFAKAAVDLANQLTHDRTANRRDATICLSAVAAIASIIKSIDTEK